MSREPNEEVAGFEVWRSVLLARIHQGESAEEAANDATQALREFQKNFHGDGHLVLGDMPESEREKQAIVEHEFDVRPIENSDNQNVYVGGVRLCLIGWKDGQWKIVGAGVPEMERLGYENLTEVKRDIAGVLADLPPYEFGG